MQDILERIKDTYSSLWHVKVLGESLEIITPMVTTSDSFVSVFVTKRGDEYVVTDGGWISAGYYGCDEDNQGKAYQKLFQYYLENYCILQTVGHGRTFYYKKVREKALIVNAVFELSHFISSVVSGANIQFQADKKEKQFRSTVRSYLSQEFKEGTFKFGKKLTSNSTIDFAANSNIGGYLQLMNIVTGSNIGYYRDSLCRSNMYFDYARGFAERLRINKTVAILDDTTPWVYNSPSIKEFIALSQRRSDNLLLPWSERSELCNLLTA